MSTTNCDASILEELKAQNIEGLTERGRLAIRELAELNEGAVIFLILSLNSRIRDLEQSRYEYKTNTDAQLH